MMITFFSLAPTSFLSAAERQKKIYLHFAFLVPPTTQKITSFNFRTIHRRVLSRRGNRKYQNHHNYGYLSFNLRSHSLAALLSSVSNEIAINNFCQC